MQVNRGVRCFALESDSTNAIRVAPEIFLAFEEAAETVPFARLLDLFSIGRRKVTIVIAEWLLRTVEARFRLATAPN